MERVNRILRDEELLLPEKNRAWEEKRPSAITTWRISCRGPADLLAPAGEGLPHYLQGSCLRGRLAARYRALEGIRKRRGSRSPGCAGRPILQRAGFHPAEIALITAAIGQHRLDAPEGHRSPLGEALHKADGLARICFSCSARQECRGLERRPQRESLIY